jgi:Xaa-Pro aminopeptidase
MMNVDWKALCAGNVERVREAMQARGIDALVLAKNESTRYLTGYQRYFCATYLPPVHMVVLLQDRGPYLLLPPHIATYGERCHAEEVHVLPFGLKEQAAMLARLVRSANKKSSRIGIEMDYVYANLLRSLEGAIENAELVDAFPLLERVMAIKSPAEVHLLRKSAALTDQTVRAIFDKAKPGVSELELGGEAGVALRGGAEFVNHLCIRSEENAFDLSPINTPRRLKDGDVLQLDIGFIYEGYVSDVNRGLVIGEASKEKADIIRVTVDVHWALLELVKPGVRVSTVFHKAVELFEKAGMGDAFRMPFIGHGLGLNLHEYPYVTPDNHAEFEPNMVIAMEPGLYAPGRGSCRMENVVLVTETGYELITDLPDDRVMNGLN